MENREITIRNDALLLREEWVAERDKLIELAGRIEKVSSDEDLKLSGDIQTAISKHIKALDVERRKVTGPIDAIKKEIMASEKDLKQELMTELDRVKQLNSVYATEQMRIENERLEIERQDVAEAELKKQAEAEELAKTEAANSPFGEDAQFAPVAEPVESVPATPAPIHKPKLNNNKMVTRWSLEIVDPQSVPREYCTVDEKKIRAYMNYQVKMGATPALDGVKFSSKVSVESR